MRNKLLTITLATTMALSLAACGSGNNEKITSDTTDAAKTVTEESGAGQAATQAGPVELKADTIDKYYGFQYAATAPDSMSAFSYFRDYADGDSFSIPSVPAKYSEATVSYRSGSGPAGSMLDGQFYAEVTLYNAADKHCAALRQTGHSSWLPGADEYKSSHPYFIANPKGQGWYVEAHTNDPGSMEYFDSIVNEFKASNCPYYEVTGGIGYFGIIAPYEVCNGFNEGVCEVTNNSGSFASVMDCNVTHIVWKMPAHNNYTCKVANYITGESKLADVVAKNAPTSGTLDASGNVVLTWLTKSGTTVDITFDASTQLPLSVSITAK